MLHNKTHLRLGAVFFIIIFAVLGAFVFESGHANAAQVTGTITSDVNSDVSAKKILPIHITIPTGGANADIIQIGVTKEGRLDVPPNFVQAGWYKYGPIPGQMGSSVIDGHVDNGGKIPGPFKNLKKVKVGDDIVVTMSNGKDLHFTVTNASVYPTNNFPGDVVFHQEGKAYLKIITCHGTFIPSQDTYNQRLVVTAVLAS